MYLYKVVDNDDVLMNGANATNQHYIIRFEGLNPNGTGMYRERIELLCCAERLYR